MMTVTNSEGKFVFTNLKDEDYLIEVSYLGYATFQKNRSMYKECGSSGQVQLKQITCA